MINYQALTPADNTNVASALRLFFLEAYGDRAQFKYPARWSWLYEQPSALSVVAWDGPRIVGWVGALAIGIALNGRVSQAAWSVDNFVLPAYRSLGIGTGLQQKAEAVVPVTLSTWVSTENLRIKERLGNLKVCDLSLLETSKLPAHFDKYNIEEPDADTIAKAAEHSASRYDLLVNRDAGYCRWRFLDQPFSSYVQLTLGYGVSLLRKCGPMRPGVGMIGDVISAKADLYDTERLIHSSAHWLLSQGCNAVRFATSDQDLLQILLDSDSGWEVRRRYAVLVSGSGQHITTCRSPFFSLSDSDMDQYPW